MWEKGGVPIWEKCLLSVDEAAEYFGIGKNTLRSFLKEHKNEGITLSVGSKTLVKREVFKKYINEKVDVI